MVGWIGVDLDGTLAEYHGWDQSGNIGKPIPEMVKRVKNWLERGIEVRIFTARVDDYNFKRDKGKIEKFCREHIGQVLPITNTKDMMMIELWDDRAVRVVKNKGLPAQIIDYEGIEKG